MNEEPEPMCVVTLTLSASGALRMDFNPMRLFEVMGIVESARAILRLQVLDMVQRPEQKLCAVQGKAKPTRKRSAVKKP